jgi:hypothetical protein
MSRATINAEPEPIAIELDRTALVIIDMQRDFLLPGGFGESLGNDVSRLNAAVRPIAWLLEVARARKMLTIHTREGHRPDLSDAPKAKVERGSPTTRIGTKGPMGRILVRGESGHDIIAELYPREGEPIIDKPGKGSFCATDLKPDRLRRHHGSVRPHHRSGGERPGLPMHRSGRLLRLVLPGVPRRRAQDDQGAGRDLRVGDGLGASPSSASAREVTHGK